MFYKLKLPSKIVNSSSITKNIQDISDIHTATVNSVIHSSMCCGKDRRSWAYQLFKVKFIILRIEYKYYKKMNVSVESCLLLTFQI